MKEIPPPPPPPPGGWPEVVFEPDAPPLPTLDNPRPPEAFAPVMPIVTYVGGVTAGKAPRMAPAVLLSSGANIEILRALLAFEERVLRSYRKSGENADMMTGAVFASGVLLGELSHILKRGGYESLQELLDAHARY